MSRRSLAMVSLRVSTSASSRLAVLSDGCPLFGRDPRRLLGLELSLEFGDVVEQFGGVGHHGRA
jgi:hypothetical protein